MNGKYILNKLILLLFIIVTGSAAWAQETAGQGSIAILLSDREVSYEQPLEIFTDEVNYPYEIYNLNGDLGSAPAVMKKILSQKPSLIFTLGAKASYVAKVWTIDHQEIPVLFAMVLNWQRFGFFEEQNNFTGIATDVDPGTQFLNMLIFFPDAKRIGAIYSEEHSGWIVEKAKQEADSLGLELIAMPINHPQDFQYAYKKIVDRIDSFWFVTDPVAFTVDNIAFFEKRCLKDQLVCIGQSENIARLGVLLAVDPDIPNIGGQAATMAKSIIAGRQSPQDFGVLPPLGTRLLLNMKTADKIGLSVSEAAKNLASIVIDN